MHLQRYVQLTILYSYVEALQYQTQEVPDTGNIGVLKWLLLSQEHGLTRFSYISQPFAKITFCLEMKSVVDY